MHCGKSAHNLDLSPALLAEAILWLKGVPTGGAISAKQLKHKRLSLLLWGVEAVRKQKASVEGKEGSWAGGGLALTELIISMELRRLESLICGMIRMQLSANSLWLGKTTTTAARESNLF